MTHSSGKMRFKIKKAEKYVIDFIFFSILHHCFGFSWLRLKEKWKYMIHSMRPYVGFFGVCFFPSCFCCCYCVSFSPPRVLLPLHSTMVNTLFYSFGENGKMRTDTNQILWHNFVIVASENTVYVLQYPSIDWLCHDSDFIYFLIYFAKCWGSGGSS